MTQTNLVSLQRQINVLKKQIATLDHGTSLAGLTDDDHTRYLDGRLDKCRVSNNANISVAYNSFYYLPSFNTEQHNAGGMHSTLVNPGRITCINTGYYVLGTTILWAGGDNSRIVEILVDRTWSFARAEAYAGSSAAMTLVANTGPFLFTEDQYAEVRVYQNESGTGALNVTSTSLTSPVFWALRVE